MPDNYRVVLIGWGAIGQRVAELVEARLGDKVSIVGVAVRNPAKSAVLPRGAAIVHAPADLAEAKPDLVVEAASREAVGMWGEAALTHAKAFGVVSTSAFCDTDLLERLVGLAGRHGSQILVPPGALAGIDGIAAAAVIGLDSVVHRIVKPPAAWRGTHAEQLVDLPELIEATTFFAGSAREAARQFPQNANVAVISALAGVGLDKSMVELTADPAAAGNMHFVSASGQFGHLNVSIQNRALKSNPKTSELAALSLVRLIANRVAPLVL